MSVEMECLALTCSISQLVILIKNTSTENTLIKNFTLSNMVMSISFMFNAILTIF